MKRTHRSAYRFAPGVIEGPEPMTWVDKLSRVLMIIAFWLTIGVVGGQIYQHLAGEMLGL